MTRVEHWLLRGASVAIIALALYALGSAWLGFALWQRDVTAYIVQQQRRQGQAPPALPVVPAPAKK